MASSILAVPAWTDPKRHLWLLSPATPLSAVLLMALYSITDWSVLSWSGPLLVYGLVNVLDWRFGPDRSNPPERAVAGLERDGWYRLVVYAYLPSQLGLTAWGGWLFLYQADSWLEQAGLVLSVGAINGLGINAAHELSHKRDWPRQWLAKAALAPALYGHFFVEHVRGHHQRVATPEDPASARMGESFWAFLPRTVGGGLRSAWRLEAERLGRQGRGVLDPRNHNLQAWMLSLLLYGALTAWLGASVLGFLLLQAAYAVSLLEVINYIEHYGLLRQRDAEGRYERCNPQHSWNSNHLVTNLLLYQLQRHADHHAHPARSFQALRHFDDSPQLPAGYAALLLPAYVPALWFRLMDPRVLAHYGGDLRRAHLLPSRREALLRRYPPPAGRRHLPATGRLPARPMAGGALPATAPCDKAPEP